MEFTSIIKGLVLGIVQGLTEFLPISSSGHLFLADKLLNAQLPIVFDILLHLATLAAVVIYTFPLIREMCVVIIKFVASPKMFKQSNDYFRDTQYITLILGLTISTLCTAPIGLMLKKFVYNPTVILVGINLLITALLLSLPFFISSTRQKIILSLTANTTQPMFPNISLRHAAVLGIVQGFAVLPGISRSGITISVAVLLGLSYAQASKYSFLMAIPAIFSSFILTASDLPELMQDISIVSLIVSLFAAFIFGIIGLRSISIIAQKGKIWYFSFYLVIIGIITLIFHK